MKIWSPADAALVREAPERAQQAFDRGRDDTTRDVASGCDCQQSDGPKDTIAPTDPPDVILVSHLPYATDDHFGWHRGIAVDSTIALEPVPVRPSPQAAVDHYGGIFRTPRPDLADARNGLLIQQYVRAGVDRLAHRLAADLEPERSLFANGTS